MITIYLACLLVVIGGFLFYWKWSNDSSKINVYVASRNIEGGTIIDETIASNGTIVMQEVNKDVLSAVESSGGNLLQDIGNVYGKNLMADVPAGTILTTGMFGTIEDGLKDPDFTNPTYINMPVTQTGAPAEGFKEDTMISIVGTLNIEGKNWIGVLTNKAKVFSTMYDETGMATQVTLMIEQDEMYKLLTASGTATLYYFNDKLDDVSQVQSEILNVILGDSGANMSGNKINLNITKTTSNEDGTKNNEFNFLTDITYEKKEESNGQTKETGEVSGEEINETKQKNIPIYTLNQNETINFNWYGEYKTSFIEHYTFDGEKGNRLGTYNLFNSNTNRKIDYNQDEKTYTYRNYFVEEGYYKISFENESGTYSYEFIIEKADNLIPWNLSTGNNEIKIEMTQTSDNYQISNMTKEFYLTKNYFSLIPNLKDYKEYKIEMPSFEKNNFSSNYFVLDNKSSIGTLANLEINNINITVTTGQTKVSIPLYVLIEKADIDYSHTEEQEKMISSTLMDEDGTTSLGGLNLGTAVTSALSSNGFNSYTSYESFISFFSNPAYTNVLNPGDDATYKTFNILLKYILNPEGGISAADMDVIGKFIYGDEFMVGVYQETKNQLQLEINYGNNQTLNLDLDLIIKNV